MGNKIAIGLGITALLGGIVWLGLYIKKQYGLLLDYCYNITGYRFKNLTAKNVNLELDVQFKNKSNLAFVINGYQINVKVNDMPIGVITNPIAMSTAVAPNTFTTFTIVASFDPSQIVNKLGGGNWITLLMSSPDMVINIEGNISISSSGISVSNLPIKYTVKLSDINYSSNSKEKCS